MGLVTRAAFLDDTTIYPDSRTILINTYIPIPLF